MQESYKYRKSISAFWNIWLELKRPLYLVLYYFLLIAITGLGIFYGYYFSEQFFASNNSESVERIMNALKLFWLVPLPYALLNFYSFVRYPVIIKPRIESPQMQNVFIGRLYFRYVTRGLNPTLVADNVEQAYHLLSQSLPRSIWCIEVVSDSPLYLDSRDGLVNEIVVPQDYVTLNNTQFKGRSLHYALSHSQARPEDWIIHLDEETQFEKKTVWAIYRFIEEESVAVAQGQRQYPKIGQGVILYGAKVVVNWLTTLADSIRVGDDYGRFRLQYENGKAYFGIHGSFIVVNNGVEQMVGLDHGPKSSITEDAYFALFAQSLGVEFGFIHGHMYEKSPFSIKDFIKQRHRWFGGLWNCAFDRNLPWRERFILAAFMLMWSVSWLCIAMIYVNLIFPTGTPVWLAVAGGISFAYYLSLYIVGYLKTFHWRDGKRRFLGGLVLQILLIPVFSVMEAIGVIYGLMSPPRGFYIVQKEINTQPITLLPADS